MTKERNITSHDHLSFFFVGIAHAKMCFLYGFLRCLLNTSIDLKNEFQTILKTSNLAVPSRFSGLAKPGGW